MRTATVVSVALHNPSDLDDPDERVGTNLDNVTALLDHVAGYDPDVVVFPEKVLHHACKSMLPEVAEPIPGPSTAAVGEMARAIDSYVVVGLYERDGEDLYNAAVLLDRDGSVLGTYRKVAPSQSELDHGITPGTEVPVWDTPLGGIGMAICWDGRYPEIGTHLGTNGADLVCFPTLGSTHEALATWAQYNGYHVAVCDKNGARMHTPYRSVRADVSHRWKNPEVETIDLHGGRAALSVATINTDCRSYSKADDGVWDWPNAIRERYPGATNVHVAQDDGVVVVECVDDDLTLDDLEAEFDMVGTREFEDGVRARVHTVVDDSPLLHVDD
jgi:hypothetical protein